MSATFVIDEKTGKTYARIPLSSVHASTFHSDHIMVDNAAANSIVSDAYDELEWHKIVNTPHVRNGLRRLAMEARRQIAAGETEEGGFAVE
ncbi:MAG TPA: hypothetical protein VJO32_02520 [Ktedonobacteraceae bacterium]|nr:hypothetical protein [Ktedonobacteraceae bacterium]